MKPIRIILVDDHPLARSSWEKMLSDHEKFEVVATCDNSGDAKEYAADFKPDIIMVDLNISSPGNFKLIHELVSMDQACPVIIISISNEGGYARHLLSIGAKGFVTKGSSWEEVINAILEVDAGNTYISKDVT